MLNEKILKNEERFAYSLRNLYSRYGYKRYKMSKFEEYDLYVRNKDFLISEGIITFTDKDGRLLALKPDVTLSIIKNSKDTPGEVQKLYYDENVYRITKGSQSFKEISQTGLECIGDIDVYDICEVLRLALGSLEQVHKEYMLDLCDASLVEAILSCAAAEGVSSSELMALISSKNADGIRALVKEGGLSKESCGLLLCLTENYKNADVFDKKIREQTENERVLSRLSSFLDICNILEKAGMSERISIDFSIVDDIRYYSGIVFKGYIKGIPSTVLSGGQYDNLMKKMGKKMGAIGFAVYLDVLDRLNIEKTEYDCDFIVLRSEQTDFAEIIRTVEAVSENSGSALVLKELPEGIRYKGLIDLRKKEEK